MGEHDKIPESRWDYLFMIFPKPWTADTLTKRYARWSALFGTGLILIILAYGMITLGVTWLSG